MKKTSNLETYNIVKVERKQEVQKAKVNECSENYIVGTASKPNPCWTEEVDQTAYVCCGQYDTNLMT